MVIASQETKLHLFLQWLKVNGAELRGCDVKYCNSTKGFGIFSSDQVSDSDGIYLVVPLSLAITPMRVLEDPLVGPECRSMLNEGEEDDRFLVMLFLMVEHLRKNSSWKPYLDLLPTEFGNPLWFTDDELLELKGTTLHRATELQKKNLKLMFNEKVKKLAEKLLALDGNPECEVRFEDYLWANSVFWTRALSIPLPQSCVFPDAQQEQNNRSTSASDQSTCHVTVEKSISRENGKSLQINNSANDVSGGKSTSQGETICVEGLVPGIDFCNHALKAVATWEVDVNGSSTGIPFSMYLLSGSIPSKGEKEISISYGNKGNEELLYLYGFVLQDNPDDYLMIHYPPEALSDDPLSDSKVQLLEAQRGALRCLLPRKLLKNGFFPENTQQEEANNISTAPRALDYSWSGQRKMPSYTDKLIFPEEFMTALRTIAMKEREIYEVSSLLEELVGTEGERLPSESEVRAAVWEACGDSGALQLLVDLLHMMMSELEEGSGTKKDDAEILQSSSAEKSNCASQPISMSRNKWASIVYRKGQKELTQLFLREAEEALHQALVEGN